MSSSHRHLGRPDARAMRLEERQRAMYAAIPFGFRQCMGSESALVFPLESNHFLEI